MVRVSIIIPTHGRPRLRPRAVEGARRAGAGVEVEVVDDCGGGYVRAPEQGSLRRDGAGDANRSA
jgi:hypothetical protein